MCLAEQQHASEADTLQHIDEAISEHPKNNNDDPTSGERHPAGLTSLPGFMKRIAQRCTSPMLVWDQDIEHEILLEAQGTDERRYQVKRRNANVLREMQTFFCRI